MQISNCGNMRQHAATCGNMRQHAATCGNMGNMRQQHAATCGNNMRQHAAANSINQAALGCQVSLKPLESAWGNMFNMDT